MAVQAQAVPRISPEALAALIDTGQALTIVDVRPPEAFFESALTILGAIQIPPDEIPRRYHEIPRDRLVVAFCEGPPETESTRAAQFLVSHGYSNVKVLEGGFNAWEALGYPTAPR